MFLLPLCILAHIRLFITLPHHTLYASAANNKESRSKLRNMERSSLRSERSKASAYRFYFNFCLYFNMYPPADFLCPLHTADIFPFVIGYCFSALLILFHSLTNSPPFVYCKTCAALADREPCLSRRSFHSDGWRWAIRCKLPVWWQNLCRGSATWQGGCVVAHGTWIIDYCCPLKLKAQ